ncbi:MAG: hypothetical protein KY397_03705, partial [Gemmatimonadetes bacterium]|nr:hypothetical protein [Gemmatimonadota bacterium]
MVRVAPRRVLEVRAVSEVVEGTPGELIEIPVDLVNRGNLSDTVSVRVELPVEWGPPSTEVRRVVTPGGRVAVPVRLVVPRRARPGEMRRVKIAASGRDTASS